MMVADLTNFILNPSLELSLSSQFTFCKIRLYAKNTKYLMKYSINFLTFLKQIFNVRIEYDGKDDDQINKLNSIFVSCMEFYQVSTEYLT
jgi:hypothetical protein